MAGVPRNGQDALVVSAPALARVILQFCEEFNAESGFDPHHMSAPQGISGMHYICMWTEMDHRQLQSIIKGERKFVTLRVADRILSVIGQVDLLYPGNELAPVPNPRWTRERWEAWRVSCEDDDYSETE